MLIFPTANVGADSIVIGDEKGRGGVIRILPPRSTPCPQGHSKPLISSGARYNLLDGSSV